jgi:hypothetical protein
MVPVAYAQGFPCVVRGTVTVKGVPTQNVTVSVSTGGIDMTNSTGGYGVDVPSGSTVTITATYNGLSNWTTVNTPASGGFVDGQNINIGNSTSNPPTLLSFLLSSEGLLLLILVFVILIVAITVYLQRKDKKEKKK